jgi:NADH:ubiquinone oxidoreductase subunit F (NADH-binding)
MKKEIDFVRVILNTLLFLAKKNCHRCTDEKRN